KSAWIARGLNEARWWQNSSNGKSLDSMVFPRVIHTLGSALSELGSGGDVPVEKVLPDLSEKITKAEHDWLDSVGLGLDSSTMLTQWAKQARNLAFKSLGQAIISSGGDKIPPPRNALRSDEIVWGRAPARFDTGGGWTDTPPYSLENGGCVIDTAVNLNGQPPIQVYLRVIDEPVIRIGSIDLGTRIEITSLDDLLDYRKATSEYALAKAALALSGLSPETAGWPKGSTLNQMLEQFGGGIELTTLAAIPKGSGLGTSSIMGAVILAVIQRAIGRTLTQKELFHSVLRLEQSLTTGGGWQDQIGGAVGGAKIVTTEPGLVPDARIHYLPADVLDPAVNNGRTLLYYTGITRLAKDILSQVVGRYLDRDRRTLSTLRQIHDLAPQVAEALSLKDIQAFGKLVDRAWQLNKQLDPNSTNDQVEALLCRIRPYIFGAKLLGAGGGGFLLMVCKSTEDANKVRMMLDAEPANERARFFDYDVNPEGLVVTVC
ncbi:MAG: GHMP family kinase ATP-binding protein, partial [Planctomycetota bacterium]